MFPGTPPTLKTGAIATWLLREAAKMDKLPEGARHLLEADYFSDDQEYAFLFGSGNARVKHNGENSRIEGYLRRPPLYALQEDYLMMAPQPESVAAQHIERQDSLTLADLVDRPSIPALDVDHIAHTSEYTYYSLVQRNGPTFSALLAEISAARVLAGFA